MKCTTNTNTDAPRGMRTKLSEDGRWTVCVGPNQIAPRKYCILIE